MCFGDNKSFANTSRNTARQNNKDYYYYYYYPVQYIQISKTNSQFEIIMHHL